MPNPVTSPRFDAQSQTPEVPGPMLAADRRSRHPRRLGQNGQVLVLFVGGLLALMAGIAIVVDGGNAFAQQRVTQNAVDAAADAGAAVLVNNVATQSGTLPKTGSDVLGAVDSVASKNGIGTPTAYYTTISGQCILTSQSVQTTQAPPCNVALDPLNPPVQVTSGSIPTVGPDAAFKPQCPLPYGTPASTPASACGVAVYGSKTFQTYVAGAIGISQLTARATATAVAGAQVNICPAGAPCGFIPVTFPTSLTVCGTTNKYDFGGQLPYIKNPPGTILNASNETIIQICGTGPGSVGWLAIQPEDKSGVADLAADIVTPDNPPLTLPLWVNAQTGNTNDKNVEDAINSYAGQVPTVFESGLDQTVTIPLYDCTADVKVVGGQQNPATNPAECSGLSAGDLNGGTGAGMYYHIPSIAAFVLDHAYINGNNTAECNKPPTGTSIIGNVLGGGNGATGCLTGWFVSISEGSVTVGTGFGKPTSAYGVQLIR